VNARALVAEFLGTFFLLFIGVGSIAAVAASQGDSLLIPAFAHGLVIAVMASSCAAISGGHFNPAVTFGAFITGKISAANMVGYIIVQVMGAILGVAAVREAFTEASIDHIRSGLPGVATGVTPLGAMILEALGTFLLVFVIFGTVIDRRAPKMGALFIGLTITAAILCFGPMTGTSINPARWLGPALIELNFTNAAVYMLAPLVGGGAAAIIYDFFLYDRKDEELPASELAP
jgi:aquaporin TIP